MAKIKARPSRLMFVLVFSLCASVLTGAAYLFAGRPAIRFSSDMRRQFISYQERLQQAEELVRSVPNPQRSLEDIERKQARFRETSGAGKQLPKIIQALGQSAADRQFNVISIKPKDGLKTGTDNLPAGVKKLFLELVFSASYQDIGEYAQVLSNLPDVFSIETITIDRQERDGSKAGERPGFLTASFIISTYMVEDL